MVLLIGLAVGVDYSMFYLKRERQERAAGRSERAALEAAAATSGRSVLISGLTVMVGDGRHVPDRRPDVRLVRRRDDPRGRGRGARLAHRPAGAALAARRQRRPAAVPFVRRLRRDDGEGGSGARSSTASCAGPRSPAASPAACCSRSPHRRSSCSWRLGAGDVPEVARGHEDVQPDAAGVPRAALPANVVVKAPNVNAPACAAAIDAARAAGARERPCTSRSRSTSTRTGRSRTSPSRSRERNRRRLERRSAALRETIIPRRSARSGHRGRRHRADGPVEGQTPTMKSNLPLVVAFVLVFAFVLMLVAFRSLVIAAKAIVLNLLSVAAAYGVLVLVFQHGVGKGLLGFSSTDGIDPVVPLLLFVILFGLSMDYHVFILSRIREAFDRGRARTRRSRTGSGRRPASSRAPRSSWSASSRSSARSRCCSSSSSASGSRRRS